MQIKAAIFDMDGTLVDSLLLWDVFWQEFGDRFMGGKKFIPREEDDKATRTLPMKEVAELIHRRYGFGASGEELLRIVNGIMEKFYSSQVQMKPGVAEFLEFLHAKGVKMCIASATAPDLIALAMKHLRIEKYFSAVFSCGGTGKGKEAPDIFLKAQAHLGSATEETWVFEDSLVAVQTAHALGMKTVAVYDRFNYGQEEMQRIADFYIAQGDTLMSLPEIEENP